MARVNSTTIRVNSTTVQVNSTQGAAPVEQGIVTRVGLLTMPQRRYGSFVAEILDTVSRIGYTLRRPAADYTLPGASDYTFPAPVADYTVKAGR